RRLAANLEAMTVRGRTFAVVGMLKDKDMAGTIQALKNNIDYWLVASLEVVRGAPKDEMLQALKEAGIEDQGIIRSFPDVLRADVYARDHAGANDSICVFGPCHTVSQVIGDRGRPDS